MLCVPPLLRIFLYILLAGFFFSVFWLSQISMALCSLFFTVMKYSQPELTIFWRECNIFAYITQFCA